MYFSRIFSTLRIRTPGVPVVSLEPVLLLMVPPDPSLVIPPLPVTVKLPLVLLILMPGVVPPLDDTLISVMFNGVVLLLRVMLTACPLPVFIVPLVVVSVLVFSVAFNPGWFEVVLVILTVPKEMVPVLVVRFTAVTQELVMPVVLLKLRAALEV